MNRWFEFFLGMSPAAALRGLRLGPKEAYRGARRGFNAAAPFAGRDLPQVRLEQILGNQRVQLKLTVMAYEDGMMPLHDAIPLLSILMLERPNEVLEIGTFMGHTARAMAESLGSTIIHTVDLPEDVSAGDLQQGLIPKDDFHLIAQRTVGREYKNSAVADRVIQHLGDTGQLDFRELGHPSFFFIDGSHTYEYCKNDSEKCLAVSQPGATFLWHDCDDYHPGVTKFLNEWRSGGKNVVRIKGTSLGYWKRP